VIKGSTNVLQGKGYSLRLYIQVVSPNLWVLPYTNYLTPTVTIFNQPKCWSIYKKKRSVIRFTLRQIVWRIGEYKKLSAYLDVGRSRILRIIATLHLYPNLQLTLAGRILEFGFFLLIIIKRQNMKIIEQIKLLHRVYKYSKSDVGEFAYLKNSIKKGEIVFDIGAHKAGYLYYLLKQVGKQGKVVGFEPQSILYTYLQKIKKCFNWKQVTIEHLALSNSSGQTILYLPTDVPGKLTSPGATIVKHEQDENFINSEKVNISTLDEYCLQYQLIPSLLKVDVEGNELNVFKGGEALLKKHRPKILVEIEARHIGQAQVLETIHFLESLGYHGKVIKGREYIPTDQFTFEKFQNLSNKKDYCNNFIFE
jgi:FkbM family methyltransferase